MMQSVLVLCLALGALSLCSGSSLRVERHGLIRASTSDNAAFMLINGKSGAQEMCLVIAGACFGACARGPRRHTASLVICKKRMALLHWSPVWTPSPPEMAGSYGRCSQGAASLRCEEKNAFLHTTVW